MDLSKRAAVIGKLPGAAGRRQRYFAQRGCVLDGRGPLEIAPTSRSGLGVKVITRSHDTSGWPELGRTVSRGVRVEAGAWIGSYSVLVGCTIGAGAIVAAGTVVRGQDVAPGVMVAGNPARVVARWDGERWVYEPETVSGFSRRLE